MRSFILVALSAVALGGLFVAYWTMQPSRGGASKEDGHDIVIPPLPRSGGAGVLRPGEVVSLKQYDRNGQLISRFSADEYIPRPDGTIHVTHPFAEFFLADHQRVEIHGDDGNVVAKDVPRIAENAFANPGPAAPPSRGRLNNVRVNLIDDAKKKTVLTMTTNNVVFDNETYRISTEGYRDEQGTMIADDEVPVHVTGDLIMEGRGLVVRWDDKDGRLDLLEIEHGNYLQIDNTAGFSLGGPKSTTSKPPADRAASGDPLPAMLASSDPGAAAQVVAPPAPVSPKPGRSSGGAPHPKAGPVIYQASFFDNVRINQAAEDGHGDQIAIDNVDRMDVDFLMKQSGPEPTTKPSPPTQPAAAPTPAPKQSESHETASPGQAGSSEVSVQTARPQVAATQPAAAAKEPPVIVHWTGVLRITPFKNSQPPVPLNPGDSSVQLAGSPVHVHRIEPRQQGTDDIRCATVLYATAGEKVWLGKSAADPKILITKTPAASARDQSPTHLTSGGTVQYFRADGKALMTGPGNAEVPLEPDQQDKHPVLNAAWSKQAEFDFTQSADRSQPAVSNGHFEGDVDIRHPRFTLRSQTLDLLFDASGKPPTVVAAAGHSSEKSSSQPNLRQVIATTGVYCQMDSGQSKKQMIECDRLVLDTAKADGKLFARHVNATGDVHAYGEDDLQAQFVDLLLRPAPKLPAGAKVKPAADDEMAKIELEKMIARDNVVAKSKDGSVATGDELQVTTEDSRQKTVLTSQTQATVTDAKGNVVRGPEIRFDSQSGRADVVGAGTLHAIQQASATQPAQPVDVTWNDGAVFDGAANRIDVTGQVLATSVDKRGYIDTAKGNRIRIDLRPKPTTRPATSAPAESPALAGKSSPKNAAGLKMDPFKGKEVSAMTIEDDATLASTLSAPNGDILQQFELAAPTIIVNEFAPDGAASRSVTVPTAGRMLSRDHRPPQKSSPTSQEAQGDSPGSARGATAFQWSKKLVYLESTHRADMVGDVIVVHQDDEANAIPVKMNCEHVIAWFEPAPKPAAGSARTKPADEQSAMQLRYLTAQGDQVVIVRDVDQVIARQVDYDPRRHVMIATGTERNPVNFSNGATGGGTAEGVEWDTVTWKMKTKNAIFDYRPANPPTAPPPKKKQPTTTHSK